MNNYRIRKILVPSDLSELSEPALKYVRYLAQPTKAQVEMLHVVHADYQNYLMSGDVEPDGNHLDLDKYLAKHLMSHISDGILGKQIKPFIHAEIGFINDVIIETASKSDSDLIVMGYYNDLDGSEMSRRIMDIIYKSPCPVLAVQPENTLPKYQKIIVPLRDREGMFDKMQYIVGLAKDFNASVHFIPFFTNSKTPVTRKRMNDMVASINALFKTENIDFSATNVQSGQYVKKTLEIAEKQQGDLVVILAEQSGFFQKLFGNADEENFLRESRLPIMTIPLEKHLRVLPNKVNALEYIPSHLNVAVRSMPRVAV